MHRRLALGACLLLACLLPRADARAAEPPASSVTLAGSASVLFDPAREGCDGNDVPDAPARVFRDRDGRLVVFGLHYTNHFLRGAGLDRLKIVCRSALIGSGSADPAAYDDKSWIAATWTRHGAIVDALVHHEFQGDSHPGACRFPTYMQCWFNTVIAARSTDGGSTFAKLPRPVVASAPFAQSVDQGRHRGFFNPSNIVSDGRFFYVLVSTTGWAGQEAGVCLFRTADPDAPDTWRAFDGTGFTIRYADPYGTGSTVAPRPCRTLDPFPAPVGSIVRQRSSGLWLAVFQAARDATRFPVSGFYTAASRDLLNWSAPHLLMTGTTNYESPCGAGGRMIAYPSLIDPDAEGRNFDDVGARAVLLFASLKVEGCSITSDRLLMRQPVSVAIGP